MLVGITGGGGALRLAGISQPRALVFDEFYAGDACLYVFGPLAQCLTTEEISVVHPPLGKWLIGTGLTLFGFNPIGWRTASLVAGTVSIAVLYLLARKLLRSTMAASIAAGLLAFDFLHFVMSRTAMLDIFVLVFGLVAFLCLLYDGEQPAAADRSSTPIRVALQRRWLIASGIAAGAAVASKWSGAYLLAAVAFLACGRAIVRARRDSHRTGTITNEIAVLVGALIVVPAVVYIASFTTRVEGTLLAWPWQEHAWVRSLVERHGVMLEHHLGALYTHPYMSPAWSWFLLKRPVLFYFRDLGGGRVQEILALGNPVVWWAGIAAVGGMVWRLSASRRIPSQDAFILAGLLAGYVPWLVIVRQQAFLYYLLPALPYLYLALAQTLVRLSSRRLRAAITMALAVSAVAGFAFFHPVLVGTTLNQYDWEHRMLFRSCGGAGATDVGRPRLQPGPPPSGWCWV
jgi:dolichyl-phosphate-mannose--protein O-mannosyl transferase